MWLPVSVHHSKLPLKVQNVGLNLAGVTEKDRKNNYPSLEEAMPKIYKELFEIQKKLEKHYKDMQDMEFTIQEGKLWMLQTRNGKRTGAAMVKIAVDMFQEKLIDEKTAVLRVEPNKLDELLHPVFDKAAMKKAKVLAQGLTCFSRCCYRTNCFLC